MEIKSAAGYIRVSTAEQATKGLSIETQIDEIEAYAKAHNMRLEHTYIDRGITARKSLEKRVDFMRMMGDVQKGKINHIIVLRLDRFFRNVYDYHKMMNEYLSPNNCDWSAVKEQYSTATTNGRLMINLRLAIAEQECDTDSDRIKDVLSHRASQGYAISGALPIGLKIENHRIVPNEEKHLVKELFDYFERYSSLMKAVQVLNERNNSKIRYSTANKMIKNMMYCGIYRDNRDYCEPIITVEQYNNAQRLLKMNTRLRKNKRVYIFSGLMICGSCGRKLSGNSSRSGAYYRCNLAIQNKMCDNNLSIPQDYVEQYLVDNVEKLLADYVVKAEIKENTLTKMKSNRKSIEKKLDRLNQLYIEGFISKEKYKNDYIELQNKIIDVPDEPQSNFSAIKKLLESNFKAIYKTLSDTDKQALWRSVIKSITVSGNQIDSIDFL